MIGAGIGRHRSAIGSGEGEGKSDDGEEEGSSEGGEGGDWVHLCENSVVWALETAFLRRRWVGEMRRRRKMVIYIRCRCFFLQIPTVGGALVGPCDRQLFPKWSFSFQLLFTAASFALWIARPR